MPCSTSIGKRRMNAMGECLRTAAVSLRSPAIPPAQSAALERRLHCFRCCIVLKIESRKIEKHSFLWMRFSVLRWHPRGTLSRGILRFLPKFPKKKFRQALLTNEGDVAVGIGANAIEGANTRRMLFWVRGVDDDLCARTGDCWIKTV